MKIKDIKIKEFVIVGISKYGPTSTGYFTTTDMTFEPIRIEVYEGKIGEEVLKSVYKLSKLK